MTRRRGAARSPAEAASSTPVFVARWVEMVIERQVVARELARRGVETTPADLETARDDDVNLPFGGLRVWYDEFDRFPAWFREQEARRVAEQVALHRALEGSATTILQLVEHANVDLDPRYGRWYQCEASDSRYAIVPIGLEAQVGIPCDRSRP